MTGLNPLEFGVNQNLVRAQFATTIYRLAGSPQVAYENLFEDVPEGLFYTEAAVWAHKNGIMTGYESNGKFGGSDDITREQMATVLFRYAQKTAGILLRKQISVISRMREPYRRLRWMRCSGQ